MGLPGVMREGIYSRASVTGKGYLNISIRPYRDIGVHFGIGESGASQANQSGLLVKKEG
jgi:hypothetical protein